MKEECFRGNTYPAVVCCSDRVLCIENKESVHDVSQSVELLNSDDWKVQMKAIENVTSMCSSNPEQLVKHLSIVSESLMKGSSSLRSSVAKASLNAIIILSKTVAEMNPSNIGPLEKILPTLCNKANNRGQKFLADAALKAAEMLSCGKGASEYTLEILLNILNSTQNQNVASVVIDLIYKCARECQKSGKLTEYGAELVFTGGIKLLRGGLACTRVVAHRIIYFIFDVWETLCEYKIENYAVICFYMESMIKSLVKSDTDLQLVMQCYEKYAATSLQTN